MKSKLYTLLIALLTSSIVNAQDQIIGVGILEIGKSTPDVINELAKNYTHKIKEAKDCEYEGNGRAIYKLVYSDNDNAPTYSSACPATEIYYLKQYTVSGMTLVNVNLFFYEGLLIQILSNGSDELDEALKMKYGNPATSSKDSKSSCPGQTNRAYIYTWMNGDIQAQVTKHYNYGSDCRIALDKYFSIKLPEEEVNAYECHKANKVKAVDHKRNRN